MHVNHPLRLDALDWLRGAAALSVMAYHLTNWYLFPLDASWVLGKLGIYAVSIFFVLSGLSMALVYDRYVVDAASSGRFYVRRLFRIWPLLWVCVLYLVVVTVPRPDAWTVALNLTTLFGFVAPEAYLNTGAWSIGNEMVYYALTPLLLAAYRRSHALGGALMATSIAVGLWFAFVAMRPDVPVGEQWGLYVNPFNNLFFYCCGIGLYYHLRDWRPQRTTLVVLSMLAVAAFLWPVDGGLVRVATGPQRVLLSAASIAVVIAAYKSRPSLPMLPSHALGWLGATTYGIYLLHPIVVDVQQRLVLRFGFDYGPWISIAIVAVSTLVLASCSYRWLELPMIRAGKRLTSH